jgi:TonB family protein
MPSGKLLMRPLASVLLLSALMVAISSAVRAQSVVCLIPPMPELPGGGGTQAIVAAIQRRITYPPQALRVGARGRVFVSFTIIPSGQVKDVFIIKSFRRDCSLAVLNAVRRLPRFQTRLREHGNVSYTVPVTFDIEGAKYPLRPVRRNDYPQALRKAR